MKQNLEKLCKETKKRKFRSPGAARRSATERYGTPHRVYRCPFCDTYHITSKAPEDRDADMVPDPVMTLDDVDACFDPRLDEDNVCEYCVNTPDDHLNGGCS